MFPKFIQHALTLQMEIVSMIAEEIQQQAESYVRTHGGEDYERFLNDLIANLEKSVDFVATPFEQMMQQINTLRPTSSSTPQVNWNRALDTLSTRIQELKNNLQA